MGGDRLRDPGDRSARAERILDATAELLLRFGYRRLTVEDVARRAGIGKGTVYLHWKTRDDVIRAVFEREVLRALDELLRSLRRDTGAWLPHRLAAAYFLAIMRRPLLTAFFLADQELLGRLAGPGEGARGEGARGEGREHRHSLVSTAYFRVLAEHGQLREDLTADEVAHAFLATLEGFIRAQVGAGAEVVPGPGVEDRARLLARTVERAFETGRALPPADERAVAAEVAGLFADLGAADRADLGLDRPASP